MSDKNNETPTKSKQSPGALLRQAREASGQTQNAIGEALHLTVHYIKSLENDEYNKLPGLTFVKGYVRAYARFLKLDVDTVLRCYDEFVGTLPEPPVYAPSTNYSYSRKRNDQAIWAIAATLLIVAGLGAGWWFVGRDAINAVTGKPAVAAVVPVASQPAPASATAPVTAPVNTFASTTTASTTDPYTTAYGAASATSLVAPAIPTADVVSAATTILPAQPGQEGVIVAVPLIPDTASDAAANGVALAALNAGSTTVAPTDIAGATDSTDLPPNPATATAVANDNLTVIPSPNGGRQLTLQSQGSDQLQLMFSGNSWVEIDDGRNVRLYNEMLRAGDTLVVQGQAPFQVLLGDGRNVQVNFNSTAIDISTSIRTDSTARLNLANPATTTVPVGATQ